MLIRFEYVIAMYMNELSSAIVSVLINNKNVQEKKKSDAENMYVHI